ncbi:MAG: helix-hairpin-helix domain-containing protein [Limisphaerales bacterium]
MVGLLPREAPLFVGFQEIGGGEDLAAPAHSATPQYGHNYQALFARGKGMATGQNVGAILDRSSGWGVYGQASRVSDLERELSEHLVLRLTNAVTSMDICVVHLRRPIGNDAIEKYLGSGMVKGIGPERRQRIKDARAGKKVIRSIMVFLHSNGVSTSRAVRIYKTYGEGAIDKVQADPYYLAKDIHGWHRPPLGRKPAWARPREAGTPSWSSGRGTGAQRTFRGPRCQPGLAKCPSCFTGLEARAD